LAWWMEKKKVHINEGQRKKKKLGVPTGGDSI